MTKIEKTRIPVEYPNELLKAVDEFQEKSEIKTRTKALTKLIEIGLEATKGNGYIKTESVREYECRTVKQLVVAIALKKSEAYINKSEYVCFSKKELDELEELTRELNTILHNLNFYRERLKDEGYSALYDFAMLAHDLI